MQSIPASDVLPLGFCHHPQLIFLHWWRVREVVGLLVHDRIGEHPTPPTVFGAGLIAGPVAVENERIYGQTHKSVFYAL
jgi:hypothetical protein